MEEETAAAPESSAKRRERLLALRSRANSSSTPDTNQSPPPPPPPAAWHLPDPDGGLEPSTPRPPTRFGYYTNPAAAFSASSSSHHKRKAPPPQGNYTGNSSSHLPHQHHMSQSPRHSSPFPMAPDATVSSPWQSPMQFQTPMSGYRGTPPGAPPPWNPHTAYPAQGSYPNSSRFGSTSPHLGRGGSPMNYGPRSGPHSYSGRGRGQHYYSNSGSRGSGGRGGLGFQARAGWQDRRSYYSKCMVDDPWQDLQTITGNILIPRDSSKSWLPESLRAKKDRSDQGGSKLNAELSLSEYLDLSFNETLDET